MFCRQFHELAVSQTVVLHEHKVPDFNHLRVVHVDEVAARNLSAGSIVAEVDVDFGARTARTGFAHFPEIVVLVAVDDAAGIDMFKPVVIGFHIRVLAVFFIAAKNGDIQFVFVNFHDFGQVFPSVGNGFLFEIVAKRPVAEHLEHGVVIGVVANFFQIIMFA